MRDINQVLDTIKERQKIGSDYKLAMVLSIGSGNLRNYRHGRSHPDEKTCAILSAALGEDPALLMVEMQAQRARDDATRNLWANLAQRLQMGTVNLSLIFAVATLFVALALTPEQAAASPAELPASLCILCLIAAVRFFARVSRITAWKCKVV